MTEEKKMQKTEHMRMEEESEYETKEVLRKNSLKSSLKLKMKFSMMSEKEEKQITHAYDQKEVVVTCQTYTRYTFMSKGNYFLLPFTLILFLVAETLNIVYFRFLSGYDELI